MSPDVEPLGTMYQSSGDYVRAMPPGPRGQQGSLDAASVLDLGASAAAAGMSRNTISRLLGVAQEAAAKAVLAAAPELLRHSRHVTQAKVNEISTRVNALRRVVVQPQPTTGWRNWLGNQPVALEDAPAYVSLAEVRSILQDALTSLIVDDDN